MQLKRKSIISQSKERVIYLLEISTTNDEYHFACPTLKKAKEQAYKFANRHKFEDGWFKHDDGSLTAGGHGDNYFIYPVPFLS